MRLRTAVSKVPPTLGLGCLSASGPENLSNHQEPPDVHPPPLPAPTQVRILLPLVVWTMLKKLPDFESATIVYSSEAASAETDPEPGGNTVSSGRLVGPS